MIYAAVIRRGGYDDNLRLNFGYFIQAFMRRNDRGRTRKIYGQPAKQTLSYTAKENLCFAQKNITTLIPGQLPEPSD